MPTHAHLSRNSTRVPRRRSVIPSPLAECRDTALVIERLLGEGIMAAPVSGFLALKRVLDCALAAVIAVVALPVALAAMALVRLTSRGPAIYTQERVGLNGRRFTIYKIRTMIHDCESLTGPRWCVPDDPRVTPVGRVLRRLHVDELPQLINVFRGEMSLVGPRPERPVFVAKLTRKIPLYPGRHIVPPGITGLAQLALPPDLEVDDVKRKLQFDLLYARKANLGLDAWLIVLTLLKVIGVPRRLIRALLPRPDVEIRHSEGERDTLRRAA